MVKYLHDHSYTGAMTLPIQVMYIRSNVYTSLPKLTYRSVYNIPVKYEKFTLNALGRVDFTKVLQAIIQ